MGLYPHAKFQPDPSCRFPITDPQILQIQIQARARARRLPVSDPLKQLDWWVSNHIPNVSTIGWAFPSYSTAWFHDIPSLCTCHALHSTPISVEIGSTHGRKNVATQERKLFAKRTCGCWDINLAKAWRRPAGKPLMLTFLCYYQRDKWALPHPLVTTPLRSKTSEHCLLILKLGHFRFQSSTPLICLDQYLSVLFMMFAEILACICSIQWRNIKFF